MILADEPMSAIDVAARIQILDTFAAIRAARPSTAIIMVSHDLGRGAAHRRPHPRAP